MINGLALQCGYNPESIKVQISGKRAGEKIYEELLTADEAINASETEDMFIITPAAKKQESKRISAKEYRSDQDGILLAKEEIKEILRESSPQPL
jgi:FlaA1/EpsC-like NDP-sugar epimerase